MRTLLAFLLVALAPMPAVRAQGTPVRLSAPDYRALNVFLSNFAEAGLQPFRQGQLTDDAKIQFVLQHVYWNGGNTSGYSVTFARANELCRRYFGQTIQRPRSGEGYRYANGTFSADPWDGEPLATAHASNVRRLPSGEWTAPVDVFLLHELFSERQPYAYTAEQMRRLSQNRALTDRSAGVEFFERRTARMRQVTHGGRTRYILLEWL